MRGWFQRPAGEVPATGSEEIFALERKEMVERQLRGRDITDARVLAAMERVPRHEFLPEKSRKNAYEDSALALSHGQTISQPYIVAFMTQHLGLDPGDHVLEVGTGSGYQAAVLAELVDELYSIEVVEALKVQAEARLNRLGYRNVTVKCGDGSRGWQEHAPFDAIIVTCAPDSVPEALVTQLKEGGRMMIPVGPPGGVQELYLLRKTGGLVEKTAVLPVRFVPLVPQES